MMMIIMVAVRSKERKARIPIILQRKVTNESQFPQWGRVRGFDNFIFISPSSMKCYRNICIARNCKDVVTCDVTSKDYALVEDDHISK